MLFWVPNKLGIYPLRPHWLFDRLYQPFDCSIKNHFSGPLPSKGPPGSNHGPFFSIFIEFYRMVWGQSDYQFWRNDLEDLPWAICPLPLPPQNGGLRDKWKMACPNDSKHFQCAVISYFIIVLAKGKKIIYPLHNWDPSLALCTMDDVACCLCLWNLHQYAYEAFMSTCTCGRESISLTTTL